MTKARTIADLGTGFVNISDTGTEGTKVASGTTAQRGSTTGQLRFNTTTGLAEYYTGTEFKIIDSPPTVTAVSPLEVDSQAGGNITFTITGSNFGSGAVVKFIGNDATEITASTTTVNSSSSISAVIARNSFVNAKEPYDVKVTNTSGLSGILDNQINVDTSPTWSTASGTLTTIIDTATGTHATVSATDVDGDTVSYSETGGTVLTTAGLTLNSATGAISGDPTDVASSTTYSFDLRATANSKNVDRAFSIIVNPSPVEIYYLLIAGGGSGGNGYGGGGGGAGGLLTNWGSTALDFYKNVSYDVIVGLGGSTRSFGDFQGYDGQNSTFGGGSGVTLISTLTAIGGGGGGAGSNISTSDGREGGSGGGGGWTNDKRGGYGTYSGSAGGGIYDSSPRQGYDGSRGSVSNASDVGGGGGGAGSTGFFTNGQTGNESGQSAAAQGGTGLQINIDGNNYYWAGGGGGGTSYSGGSPSSGGHGGLGGGGYGIGNGNGTYLGSAINGSAGGNDAGNNTGGGGGAGGLGGAGSGVGGSGILILRYPSALTLTVGSLASNTINVGSDKVTYITGTGTGTVSLA
jgi:hypothetical protein